LADLENRSNALRTLGSGCYLSEADKNEPNFETIFYGAANYRILLAAKKKYDPTGVLYCPTCIDSSSWMLDPDQRLCRVPHLKTQGGLSRDLGI